LTVEIRLTGKIAISDGHHSVDEKQLAGRQGRLLFVRLALESEPIHKEVLANLLWKDELPVTWERTLSGLLSRVRTAMANAGFDGLTIRGAFGNYELQYPAGTIVDVRAAAADAEAAVHALASGDLSSAADRAEAAAEIARRPLLAGEDGPWLEKTRSDLRATLVSALESFADARAGTAEAVVAAQEASDLEPYRERAHVLLMRAHAALGNRADALRAYERCRELLTNELGVDPSAETQAAHVELLREDPSIVRRAGGRDRLSLRLTADLPSGLVTFCLTDIEGSTQLFSKLGPRFLDLLEDHRRIIRKAVANHGGAEVKTEGDGFLVAFGDAGAAVDAAMEFQRGLAAHPWPEDNAIRVRVGLHSGEAVPVENDYTTFAVHETARIGAAAHGGQTIVSNTVARHLEGRLPEGTTLRDLGEHELRDLGAMRLHQVCHADLPDGFPPLRTMGGPRGYVPAIASNLIGRSADLDEIEALLRTSRLLTVTGSGGVGKTRLAIETARAELGRWIDGVWFVDLAPLADETWLEDTVLQALGVVRDTATPGREQVLSYLGQRNALLVIDNCEHLIEACRSLIGEVIRRCPHTSVMATSRQSLGIDGEVGWRARSLGRDEASRLFVDRAKLVRPNLTVDGPGQEAIERIVDRLDGIPLAIELAAARMRVLTAPQIAARLDDRFSLLTSGSRSALPRQRTLEATVEWSYALLGEEERALFQVLSVFVGGFDLEAADAVSAMDALDVLDRLVDKSMVATTLAGDAVRYRMLETIRQFGWRKTLDVDAGDAARTHHLAYFVDLVEDIADGLRDEREQRVAEILDGEHDNIRAALDWAISIEDRGSALRIVAGMCNFWALTGRSREGLQWISRVLPRSEGLDPELLAQAYAGAASLALLIQESNEQIARYARHAVDHARSRTSGTHRWYDAWAMQTLAIASNVGDFDPSLFEQAVIWAKEADDATILVEALTMYGEIIVMRESSHTYDCVYEEVAAFARKGSLSGQSDALFHLAMRASEFERYDEAVELALEALTTARRGPNIYHVCLALHTLGSCKGSRGDADAEAPLLEAIAIAEGAGLTFIHSAGEAELGWLLVRQGSATRGRERMERALELVEPLAESNLAMLYFAGRVRNGIAAALQMEGRYVEARKLCEENLALAEAVGAGSEWIVAFLLNILGSLSQDEGDLEGAVVQHLSALEIASETYRDSLRSISTRATAIRGLAGVALRRGELSEAARLCGATAGVRELALIPQLSSLQYRAIVERLRRRLGDAFDPAWNDGVRLGLEGVAARLAP
jgi:predicted ATPase/class 3 adenylate cyclase